MQIISIIICTRKKNKNLIKCLRSIKHFGLKYKFNLIIIENNLKKTLKKKDLKKLNLKNNFKIFYHIEKRIGIPFARNKGLKILKKIKSDFVCFFDDDCEISNNWLNEMIKTQKKYDADIVTGPQISKSKNILLKALERKNKHLSVVKWAATNNVFAKVKIILNAKLWFTQKLKNIGGSDQLFFLKLYNQGCKIIWNNKSKVFEQKNVERENFTWFVKRNIRYGTSSIIIFQELYGKFGSIYFCILKSIYELLLSILFLITIFLNPRLNFFKSFQYFLRSLSTFLGIFGLRYKEYIRAK